VRSLAIAALLAVMAVLAGCSDHGPAPSLTYDRPPSDELTPGFVGAPTLPPPDLTNDGPGSLVSVEPYTDANIDGANATAVKVVYRSTSGVDGAATEVSGVVAVPPGIPPKGGWPILSFAHSLIGVLPKCGASMADGLWGYSQTMATLVGRGFVVALPDYQGLGTSSGGPHSIVDAASLGNNVIDAARAARRVLPSASTRWAAFGIGEGGLAAWAAAERAGIYGGGMDLVGSVAIAPYADLSPMVDTATSGQFAGPQQIQMYIQVLQSLENADPRFDLDAQRSASARQQWDLLTDCAPKDPQQVQQALTQLKPEDVRPHNPAAAADARQRLADAALPARYPTPGSAPVFVVFGTADTSTPALGIQQALASACAKGDRIEVNKRAGDTEVTNDQIIQSAIAWMVARFDGQRLGNVCVGAT
jgi:pimeloyl-ACP methyl ester carboxylesterase